MPLFFEINDLWPQTLIEMGLLSERNPVTWGLRALEKFLLQKAEKIITLLPHIEDYTSKLGIPRGKIYWIPNGVDISRYKILKPYEGGRSNMFTIMYVGGHLPSYGLDVILDAAKILQNEGRNFIKFIFVGGGSDKPRLLQYYKNLGLHNVEFRDSVPKSEIVKVLGEADAFIHHIRDLPLLKYGISPNKLCDYLAAGRPIIFGINARNNPVEEAKAGLTIPPCNAKALAEAIKKLVAMTPEERVQMGKNGMEYAKNQLDINILAHKLEKILLYE